MLEHRFYWQHQWDSGQSQLSLLPRDVSAAADSDQVLIQSLHAVVQSNDSALLLNEFNASVWQGQIRGQGNVDLTGRGNHELQLQWQDLQPGGNLLAPSSP